MNIPQNNPHPYSPTGPSPRAAAFMDGDQSPVGLLDLPLCVLVLLLRRLAHLDMHSCASLMSTCRALAAPSLDTLVFQHSCTSLAGETAAALWLKRELSLSTRPHARAYVELRRASHVVSHLWRGVGDSTLFSFFFSPRTASLQCAQLTWKNDDCVVARRVAHEATLEIVDSCRLVLRFPGPPVRSPSNTALSVAAVLSSPVGSPLSSAAALSHAASTIAMPRRRRRQQVTADDLYLVLVDGSARLKRRSWADAWRQRVAECCDLAWIPAPYAGPGTAA